MVIAGGSGFLGRVLVRHFSQEGYRIVVLSRKDGLLEKAKTVIWDGATLGPWVKELERADVLINMAGRSVNCRYTLKNRSEIMDSRLMSTRVLGEAIQQCSLPPRIWFNSSTATIYKHRFEVSNDEEEGLIGAHPEARDDFSVEVALAWEKAFSEAVVTETRKLTLRTAMVLGNEPGGVYEVLRRLVRYGLGGKMGNGQQYVSWLHETDFCEILGWLIDHDESMGIYNLCSPYPVTNKVMMDTFRRVIGVPFGLPASRLMLEIGAFAMRTETELMIKSRRVIPSRLLRDGYVFRYTELEEAIRKLEQMEVKKK